MRELNPQKVFVQYRDKITPYGPIVGRKYTITHSDVTADLFVFVAENYAEDQITKMRDEVRINWEKNEKGFVLMGSVLVMEKVLKGFLQLEIKYFIRKCQLLCKH
ncbi:MAG: staygreen family protein [Clostridium sp.]